MSDHSEESSRPASLVPDAKKEGDSIIVTTEDQNAKEEETPIKLEGNLPDNKYLYHGNKVKRRTRTRMIDIMGS